MSALRFDRIFTQNRQRQAEEKRMSDALRQRQEALAAGRRAFQKALQEGAIKALDRFGDIIEPGQKVLYEPTFTLLMDVVDVKPVLDHTLPAGLLDVVLRVEFPLRIQANLNVMSLSVKFVKDPNAKETPDGEAASPPDLQITRPDGDGTESPHPEAPAGDSGDPPDPPDARPGVGEG